MEETKEAKVNKSVNRHMARLLSELTDAGCPALFVDSVKSKLQWLRSDLAAIMREEQTNDRHTPARQDYP